MSPGSTREDERLYEDLVRAGRADPSERQLRRLEGRFDSWLAAPGGSGASAPVSGMFSTASRRRRFGRVALLVGAAVVLLGWGLVEWTSFSSASGIRSGAVRDEGRSVPVVDRVGMTTDSAHVVPVVVRSGPPSTAAVVPGAPLAPPVDVPSGRSGRFVSSTERAPSKGDSVAGASRTKASLVPSTVAAASGTSDIGSSKVGGADTGSSETGASGAGAFGAGGSGASATGAGATGAGSSGDTGSSETGNPETEVSETEVSYLRRTRAALKSDPARALALADGHAARFPRGALVQEREIIAIDALTRLQRIDVARARAAAFRDRYPSSAHLSRVNALAEGSR